MPILKKRNHQNAKILKKRNHQNAKILKKRQSSKCKNLKKAQSSNKYKQLLIDENLQKKFTFKLSDLFITL